MLVTDPISDMLTRIRNALMARHEEVSMPASKLKAALARVLKDEGYITGYEVTPDDKQGVLNIQLKYADGVAVIDGLKRISKPSCRVYVKHDQIPPVLSGLGVAVLSTPKGVMADRQARAARLGGEILCEVW